MTAHWWLEVDPNMLDLETQSVLELILADCWMWLGCPGLVPAYMCVRPGTKDSVSPLMAQTTSWGLWLWGPRCYGDGVSIMWAESRPRKSLGWHLLLGR